MYVVVVEVKVVRGDSISCNVIANLVVVAVVVTIVIDVLDIIDVLEAMILLN